MFIKNQDVRVTGKVFLACACRCENYIYEILRRIFLFPTLDCCGKSKPTFCSKSDGSRISRILSTGVTVRPKTFSLVVLVRYFGPEQLLIFSPQCWYFVPVWCEIDFRESRGATRCTDQQMLKACTEIEKQGSKRIGHGLSKFSKT